MRPPATGDKADASQVDLDAAEARSATGDALSTTRSGVTSDSALPTEAMPVGSANRPAVQHQALIATGTISLHSDNLDDTRADITRVVDEQRGQIAQDEATAGDQGETRRARMVLRIPTESFDDTVAALTKLGEAASVTKGTKDVTTQVIDTEARVRAQTKSLERIESLLAEATDLSEVIAIESQLARRQADLDSLKSQLAWLKDQTSLSTITVNLAITEPKDDPQEDEDGFVAGLTQGWHTLTSAAGASATALGAALPFIVLLTLIGFPIIWAVRRRRPGTTPQVSG